MKSTDKEVYYNIMPVLRNERLYSFWDIVLVTGAFAIATWVYVQGGTVASTLGFKAGLTQTFFGMILAGIPLYFVTNISAKNGIDIWVYLRAILGHRGVTIFGLLFIAGTSGYSAINAKVYANSILQVTEVGGITLSNAWEPWIAITCLLFGLLIALKGPIAVKVSTRIMVPSLLAVGVFILITVFSKFSISELAAVEPPDKGLYGDYFTSYMMVMEWNVAYIIAWFSALGAFARLSKTVRGSYWGHMSGYSVIMAAFVCIGMLTSIAMFALTGISTVDPTEWLIELGGARLGVVALLFIVIANVSTQAVSLYGLTIAVRALLPNLKFKSTAIVLTAWPIFLTFWGGVWTYYHAFIAVLGSTAGAVVALLLADYYVVRRRKFSLRGLYRIKDSNKYHYTGGFNIPAWVSFAVGLVSYFMVYDPVNAVIRSKLFLFTTATGLTMLVTAGVYILLSLFKPVNNYLRKDVDNEDTEEKNVFDKGKLSS